MKDTIWAGSGITFLLLLLHKRRCRARPGVGFSGTPHENVPWIREETRPGSTAALMQQQQQEGDA